MKKTDQSGFSLAEMLVAVGVLALLVTSLGLTLRTVLAASAQSQAATEQDLELATAERVLRDLVRSAVWTGTNEEEFRFVGGVRRLQFSSMDRNQEIIRIEIVPGQDHLLSLSIRDQTYGERSFEEVYFRGHDDLSFLYYGQKGREAPRWHAGWEGDRPPRLVRLTGAGFRFDLQIIAEAPMICAFDPVSRTCRNVQD